MSETGSHSTPDFIQANFGPDDRLAILAIDKTGGRPALTRTTDALSIVQPAFQRWLYVLNGKENRELSICMNPIQPGRTQRRKETIAEVRHIHLDLDHDAERALSAIRSRVDVPQPSLVLTTSPGHYQAVWRVQGMDTAYAEGLMRNLIHQFGADPAASDVTRGIRLPGFLNNKYPDKPRISYEQHSTEAYGPERWPAVVPGNPYAYEPQGRTAEPAARPARSTQPAPGGDLSSRDWAITLNAISTKKLTPDDAWVQLMQARGPGTEKPKPDPRYYASVTVERAVQRLKVQDPVRYGPLQFSHGLGRTR